MTRSKSHGDTKRNKAMQEKGGGAHWSLPLKETLFEKCFISGFIPDKLRPKCLVST